MIPTVAPLSSHYYLIKFRSASCCSCCLIVILIFDAIHGDIISVSVFLRGAPRKNLVHLFCQGDTCWTEKEPVLI